MIFGTLNYKNTLFFGKVQQNKPSFFQFGTSQPDIVEKFCIKHPCRSVLTGALLCIRGAPRMHSRALQVATTVIEGLCACTHGGPTHAIKRPCARTRGPIGGSRGALRGLKSPPKVFSDTFFDRWFPTQKRPLG